MQAATQSLPSFDSICVCGAGTMGSGIALCAAQNGLRTIQFDVNPSMLEKSKLAIEANLETLLQKGKITIAQRAEILSRLHFTNLISDAVAPVVIEAIVESYAAKAQLFQQLAAVNGADAIFATNTSSLSITELYAQIGLPIALAGMHFFNPAPVMKLVELVKGTQTSPSTIDALLVLAGQLKKSAVVCADSPGFVVNRVARPYYLEAMRLFEMGVASAEEIDAILEASGFKMGPFKLMDLIGLDVNYTVSEQVWQALGKPPRLVPAEVQKKLVQQGLLGRKSGQGFFEYST